MLTFEEFRKGRKSFTLQEALQSDDPDLKDFATECDEELIIKLHHYPEGWTIGEDKNGAFDFLFGNNYEVVYSLEEAEAIAYIQISA
jgi:hypothetical protein